jgi:hypothetical protein
MIEIIGPDKNDEEQSVFFRGIGHRRTYFLVLAAISTPIAIPWSVFPEYQGSGWDNMSISWAIVQLILGTCGFILIFASNRKGNNSKRIRETRH